MIMYVICKILSMARHGIAFGLNYDATPEARLRGCHNDVHNIEKLLKSPALHFDDVRVFLDNEAQPRTTARHIIEEMNDLATRSWSHNLEVAWIHYSGHGCSVFDMNGDEKDRRDECIVPSDYKQSGVVSDDVINRVLRRFNPKTRVICIFDCCHSGTIADLKYVYKTVYRKDGFVPVLDNRQDGCSGKVIMLSGCLDYQTSADAFNVRNMHQFSGAMTSCLLLALEELPKNNWKVFDLLEELRKKLKEKRFTQLPQLSSSFIINDNERFI